MKPEDFRSLTESARQILSGEPSSLNEQHGQPNYLEREYDLDDLPDDLFPEKEEEPEEIIPNPYGLTLLGILGLLSRGWTIAQIAAFFGVPIVVVASILAGFNYESPIGEPLEKNPMGTPLPPKPHQQHPIPWGTPQA